MTFLRKIAPRVKRRENHGTGRRGDLGFTQKGDRLFGIRPGVVHRHPVTRMDQKDELHRVTLL